MAYKDKAQKTAHQNDYISKAYDRVNLLVSKGDKEQIKQAAAVQGDQGINILQLVLHASLPVQLVMALLLLASIASWVIIIRKKKVLDRALREADDFEDRFWSGNELGKLYDAASRHQEGGMEAIFEAGYREFHKSRNRRASGRSMAWSRTSSSWPTSVRSARTSACSARCGAS